MRTPRASLVALSLALLQMTTVYVDEAAAGEPNLQSKLIEIGRRDQEVRKRISSTIASAGVQSEQFRSLAREMTAVDQANFAELRAIVAERGWPGIDVVGAEASDAAFLVLQHAALPEQKELLAMFQEAVIEGQARPDHLALLEDRILVREGKRQKYGSQVTMGPDGIPRLDPIEDPEGLDARRKAIGLPPIEEYLRRAEADLGKPIDSKALRGE
jgi:hypothetical protein